LDKFKKAIEIAHRFGTPNIRVFSYYPPADQPFDGNWAQYKDEVIRRMKIKAEIAAKENIVLFHENEHKIYGDSQERVLDVLKGVNSPNLRGAYDAANYVFCGFDPLAAWHATKEYTSHLHIKDWATGEEHGRIAGTGDGRIPESIADCVKRGYRGFATMEPHLRGGGPTGGVTGPDLFPLATRAFQQIVEQAGGTWN
jgi:sugar phosphate isomerase/epimerase